jgi:hypothetical protein
VKADRSSNATEEEQEQGKRLNPFLAASFNCSKAKKIAASLAMPV